MSQGSDSRRGSPEVSGSGHSCCICRQPALPLQLRRQQLRRRAGCHSPRRQSPLRRRGCAAPAAMPGQRGSQAIRLRAFALEVDSPCLGIGGLLRAARAAKRTRQRPQIRRTSLPQLTCRPGPPRIGGLPQAAFLPPALLRGRPAAGGRRLRERPAGRVSEQEQE